MLLRTVVSIAVTVATVLVSGCSEKKLEAENAAIKAENAATKEELAKVRSALESATKELSLAKAAVPALISQNEAVVAEKGELTAKLTALRSEVATLTATNDQRASLLKSEAEIKKNLPAPTFEIVGEVFIATQGGTSYKLGATEIDLYPRVTIDRVKTERDSARKTALALLEPRLVAAKAAAGKSKQKANEILTPSYSGAGSKLYSDALSTQISDETAAMKLQWEKDHLFSGAYFFEALPPPTTIARTNSDGKFKISASRGSSWVLAAKAKRNIGSDTERYYWVVPVEPTTSAQIEVNLSNDTLTTAGGSLITTSE